MRSRKLGKVESEWTSHNSVFSAIFVQKKISKLVEIWRSSGKNNFAQFLRHGET